MSQQLLSVIITQRCLVTSSRVKTIIVLNLTGEGEIYGNASRALTGHNDPAHDIVLSSDGQYSPFASLGRTLRLWRIKKGESLRKR